MSKLISAISLGFILCFISIIATFGQTSSAGQLSPQAEISLLTCAPGSALFEAFGHTAVRIHDPQTGFDRVYNYGVFDFDQPNFYVNFARGYLLYKLGTADFQRFLYQYAYFQRTVDEQILNLSLAQKQATFRYLQNNSLPEHRDYYYDYFFDNCSTRPRDVFVEILGDSLHFDYSYADNLDYSIRDLIDLYIEDKKQYAWGDLGIDLGLGANIDRPATPYEYMYQPEFLYKAFDLATIRNPDGSSKPLVKQSRTLYQGTPQTDSYDTTFTPAVVFWILLIVIAIVTAFEFQRHHYLLSFFDFLLFAIIGLYGVLIVFLWFFTNHISAANNWNMLWALPTHLIFAIFLLIRFSPSFIRYYFIATGCIALSILVFWAWLPQELHFSLIPLIFLMLLRSVSIIKHKFSLTRQK